MKYRSRIVCQSVLWLGVCLCFVSGCKKDLQTDEIETLRKEVAQLRQEVASLKGRLSTERRQVIERERKVGHVEEAKMRHGDRHDVSDGSIATGGVRRAYQRMMKPTHEELKARHEAMRDPEKREQLRAEHKARMEERRARMEERRARMEERRQRHQNDNGDVQTGTSK